MLTTCQSAATSVILRLPHIKTRGYPIVKTPKWHRSEIPMQLWAGKRRNSLPARSWTKAKEEALASQQSKNEGSRPQVQISAMLPEARAFCFLLCQRSRPNL